MPVENEKNDCAFAAVIDETQIVLINRKRIIFISKICQRRKVKNIFLSFFMTSKVIKTLHQNFY